MTLSRITVCLTTAATALLLGGCGPDAICSSGEYPVLQVGGTGRTCVPDGEEPPSGYTRFPAGEEPQHVDDDWDLYWRTHTVDAGGKVVESR